MVTGEEKREEEERERSLALPAGLGFAHPGIRSTVCRGMSRPPYAMHLLM